jgi:hypothetical protein
MAISPPRSEALLKISVKGIAIPEAEIDDDCDEEIEALEAGKEFDKHETAASRDLHEAKRLKVDTAILAAASERLQSR